MYYLGTDLTHCLLDFIILALPVYEVVRIKMVLGQKIAVVGIFSIGSVYVFDSQSAACIARCSQSPSVGVASIFQIVESQRYPTNFKEFPFQFSLAMIWANVEIHLAVFTSCLALLRPIFRKIIPGLSSGNTYYTNGYSNPSNTYQPSLALQRTCSPRQVEEAPDSSRALAYPDYDAISLPGIKDLNSISTQGSVQHREHAVSSVTESHGDDSISSQNSVR
ncbi:hypothetical protein F66182_4480 [Fusarium sp. NRRL 66182]|nr:hypothetical protein F66182_4480 [Fusarium sp. NRRL 66182]